MRTEQRFDKAVARAELQNAWHRQSEYGAPMGSISEIAHAALDELDRFAKEATLLRDFVRDQRKCERCRLLKATGGAK